MYTPPQRKKLVAGPLLLTNTAWEPDDTAAVAIGVDDEDELISFPDLNVTRSEQEMYEERQVWATAMKLELPPPSPFTNASKATHFMRDHVEQWGGFLRTTPYPLAHVVNMTKAQRGAWG